MKNYLFWFLFAFALSLRAADSYEIALIPKGTTHGRIPVVIIDSALESQAPSSFVATDNREGGRIAARNLGKFLGGQGNAIMLRYAVGSASTEEREAGFLEVMQRDFPG